MKFAISAILIVLIVIIQILRKKEKLNNKKSTIFSIVLIVLFLEFTIFNINSYRMNFSKAPSLEYERENLNEIASVSTDGYILISLTDLNLDVKTIYLELENMEEIDVVDYEIFYSDDTTIGRALGSKTYNDFVPKTKYSSIYLSGNAKAIDIKVYNQDVNISKVALNIDIPFEFNFVRVIILIIVCYFIYSLHTNNLWKVPYNHKNLNQNLLIMLVVDIAILIIYFFNTYCSYTNEPVEDLYNNSLIKALSNKQVNLLEEPAEELINLNNPYDTVERNNNIERDNGYIWDAALYNGNYYVYFGVLPALILFLPYNLITGKLLATATGVLIFSLFSIIALCILVKELFKKYFPNVPFKFMFFSEIIMLFGTMLIWINVSPRFYELVTVAGFFFAILGFLFILTADSKKFSKETLSKNKVTVVSKNSKVKIEDDIKNKHKNIFEQECYENEKYIKNISYIKIFLGTLCLALAVACRPTELFVSFLIVPYLWRIFKQNLKQKKNIVKFILVVLIPYITVGVALMWYNYIRFGSIFEFGSNYQLTINDMKHLGLRLVTIPTGLLCNLFNLPCFKAVFPFISSNGNIPELLSYYYVEDIPGGIFFIAPIAFFCFGFIKFIKNTNKKELKSFVISLILIRIIISMFC